MSETCQWLHQILEELPLVTYPFGLSSLPENAIYFFYEEGETWGHGGDNLRIVRVGTHRGGTFRGRMNEHYLVNDSKMDFDIHSARPHDRSIFRKNIGRALLNRDGDNYLHVWDLDLISANNRTQHTHLRDVGKEKALEREVTRILRQQFCFRFIVVDDRKDRVGDKGLERAIIGTVAQCHLCTPSEGWLGNHSPIDKVRTSGLWQVQHLNSPGISENDRDAIERAVRSTLGYTVCEKKSGMPGFEIGPLDLAGLSPKDVIAADEGKLEEYERHIRYFGREALSLRLNAFIIEKTIQFPFYLFTTSDDWWFFTTVYQNSFDAFLLGVSKLLRDSGPDVCPIPWFKNRLMNDLVKPEYKDSLRERLRRVKLDERTKHALHKVERIRNARIAHLQHNYVRMLDTDRILLGELRALRDHVLELVGALSFNEDHCAGPPGYDSTKLSHGTDQRTDLEKILDDIAARSSLIRLPEDHPDLWPARRAILTDEELEIVNRYRKRLDLPEV